MTPSPENHPLELDLQLATHPPELPEPASFSLWAGAAADAAGIAGRALTVRIVDAGEMRRLNGEYRGQDRATNVLAFAFDPIRGVETDLLGDVVICAPVVADEARRQGKSLPAHWAHMVIHGVLHLCGYDHADDRQAAEMEALEVRLLGDLGYPDPYRGPAGTATGTAGSP